jgi:uncharacterized OB-fold protein
MIRPLAAPFLESANSGVLSLQRCIACGLDQLPPRARCARCGSVDFEWVRASGRGTIASFAVIHRAPAAEDQARVPYVYAVVELVEGPRIVTNVRADPGTLVVGEPVVAVFERSDGEGQRWPEFEPAP